jgi:lysozyme
VNSGFGGIELICSGCCRAVGATPCLRLTVPVRPPTEIPGSVRSAVLEEIVAPTLGIDVSHFQGSIDWAAVHRSGVVFAFAKASEGTSFTDSRYVANVRGMRHVGVQPGAYHFLQAGNGAGQARHFMSVVGNPVGVMLALDVERLQAPRPDANDVTAFANELRRLAPGHPMIVYTGQTFWRLITGGMNGKARGWVLWDAGTGERPDAYVPGSGSLRQQWSRVRTKNWHGYGGWTAADRRFLQFTDSAEVPGVDQKCDGDAFFGDQAEMLRLSGRPQSQKPPPPRPTRPARETTMFIARPRGAAVQYLVSDNSKRVLADSAESKALAQVLGAPVEMSTQTLATFPTVTAQETAAGEAVRVPDSVTVPESNDAAHD